MTIKKDATNLANESPRLYKTIEDLIISKPWLSSKVYRDEWREDEATQRKLTIRLRNKLNGNGSITPDEIKDIENALLDFADILRKTVEISKAERSKKLQKKIQGLLDHLEENDKKTIKNNLNQ